MNGGCMKTISNTASNLAAYVRPDSSIDVNFQNLHRLTKAPLDEPSETRPSSPLNGSSGRG
jgi:hypothetical protein